MFAFTLSTLRRTTVDGRTVTIAVAVKTGSALVFAADSVVTTWAVAGFEKNGKPRVLKQTYDNATKVVADVNRRFMGMIAGSANLEQGSVQDFLSRQEAPPLTAMRENWLFGLVKQLTNERRDFWKATQLPPDRWRGSTILLGAPATDGRTIRAWRLGIEGDTAECREILREPGIRLEGSYGEVYNLLYGYDLDLMDALRRQLRTKPDRFGAALSGIRVLRPIDKINLSVMPVQDAINLAVFLCEVQVQMDRFLPGEAACGGPIDVLVLQTAPSPGIVAYPGKATRHPRTHQGGSTS